MVDPICLWPGDLLLVRRLQPKFHQRKIEAKQAKVWDAEHSIWTHAAVIKADYTFVEMNTDGPKFDFIWSYDNYEWDLKVRRIKRISKKGGYRLVDAAYENLSLYKQYDFFAPFKFLKLNTLSDYYAATPRVTKTSICSAFYARAASRVGRDVGEGIDYRIVPPAKLSESSVLKDIPLDNISPAEVKQWIDNERSKLFLN